MKLLCAPFRIAQQMIQEPESRLRDKVLTNLSLRHDNLFRIVKQVSGDIFLGFNDKL